MVLVPDKLTWRCDVCHEERPDALIGVYSDFKTIKDRFEWQVNVKYCIDKAECTENAPKVAKEWLKVPERSQNV